VVGIETGALFPTGKVKDEIFIDGIGRLPISIVDCGNPCVFINSETIGLKGTELPEKVDPDPKLLDRLELLTYA
jgi:2-methylaconitate cis-trans-isomerase PrpF